MAFLDKAGLERLWAHIVSLVGTKVEKVEGKGLSTEDFTTEEKIKLADIEEGATRYVHPVSEVEAGAYTKVTVDAQGHVISGDNPITLEEYGITDAVTKAELNEYATTVYVDEQIAQTTGATSWNDLEDRPFYTESATLLQENSLAVKKETYYNYYSYEYEGEAVPFIPVAGTTYTIVFNGTTYTCVGKLSGNNPYIGNDVKNNVFVSGQEPFQIYYSHYWNSLTISTKALGPHSITVTANEIHKIEEKYLPDNLARTDVAQEMTAENTFTVSPIIPAPTEGDHAANKDYVDAQINTSVAAAIDGKLMMVEYTPYSNGTSELSHTFEEIYDAAIANKIIVFRRTGGWQHYILTEYSTHAVHFSLVSSADANLGAPIMACVVIDENNTVTESTYSTVRLSKNIGVLPGQTIKVKSLINGLPAEWEAVDLLSADHTHDAENITDGVLSVAQGGTGQTSIVDTVYTAPRYRASALVSTETTPTSNGVITWVYE